MKVNLIFRDGEPRLAIYGLEGVIVSLYGRTVHVISKDPWEDDLSTSTYFFVEQQNHLWRFGSQSNCRYSQAAHNFIFNALLDKANQALAQAQPTDLSQEFTALNQIEPFCFGGLFPRMNEQHYPIFEHAGTNLDFDEMREKLKQSMTPEEIEADEDLQNFVYQIPVETILVDETAA
jgi:hypothetical protein